MISDDVLPFGFLDDGREIEEIINTQSNSDFWNGFDSENKW
jgi:hypothetical protein